MAKKKENLIVYIPENLDLEKLIADNPPAFKCNKDKLAYIVHLITFIRTKNKKTDEEDKCRYVPLHSSLLQRKVGKNYRQYLDYLVENGVLEENRQYITGKISRSFCITCSYSTPIIAVEISQHCLTKAIKKFHTIKKEKALPKLSATAGEYSPTVLEKWFNKNLTVNKHSAVMLLQEMLADDIKKEKNIFSTKNIPKGMAMDRFNSRLMPILKIELVDYSFTIDTTAGRFHTVLTQVKSELRKYLKYNDQTLVSVDISNSQPYLLLCLLDNDRFVSCGALAMLYRFNRLYEQGNKHTLKLLNAVIKSQSSPDAIKYQQLVTSGNFYENFAIELEKLSTDGKITRQEAKQTIMSSLFNHNAQISKQRGMQLFKKLFPSVYEVIHLIKYGKHSTLACVLQSIEVNAVLHRACGRISAEKPDLPIFTLHDSIITTKGYEEYIHKVLFETLTEIVGFTPNLKIEFWE